MLNAKQIESIVRTGAKHVLYRKDGNWYHNLKEFPGALFDYNGYIIFQTKEDYESNRFLRHRQDLNVEPGISAIPGYIKFTPEEIEKVKVLDNKLSESSKIDWQKLLAIAKKSKERGEIFFSPEDEKPYRVISISENTIGIKKEKGEDSKIGEKYFLRRMSELDKSNGKISKKDFKGDVAKVSTIVYLHPLLQWSNDYQSIIVIHRNIEQDLLGLVKSDIDSFEDENSSDFEGGLRNRLVNYFERNPKLRAKAIEIHGVTCKVCEFNFKEYYGLHGEDYIEVHHLVPIHTLNKSSKVNPATDMIVVCANCHRMIHRKKNAPLSIEQLIQLKIKK